MEKAKQKYLVLIKLNPHKSEEFFNKIYSMHNDPVEGVRLINSFNLFGQWDIGIWFEAENNEKAVYFVGDQIRPVEGVIQTLTMPTTVIKEY